MSGLDKPLLARRLLAAGIISQCAQILVQVVGNPRISLRGNMHRRDRLLGDK